MIGIAPHDVFDAAGLQKLGLVLAQMQGDFGAAFSLLGSGHGEFTFAVRHPANGRILTGLARQHLDLVGHDERRVKADPELADELAVFFLVAAELGQKLAGSRTRDGAEVVAHVLLVHAHAVVGNGERAGVLVDCQGHFEVGNVAQLLGRLYRQKPELLAGIRSIGDQLAKKDLLVGIHGVNHQLQQLAGFRLKAVGLRGGGHIGVSAHDRDLWCLVTGCPL